MTNYDIIHKPYTNAEINRIVRMRQDGHHTADIADAVGRTKTAIDRLVSIEKKKRGITYPPVNHRNLKWNDYRIEQMARKASDDISYRELGQQNGGISAPRVAILLAKRAHGLQDGTWKG